MMTNEKLANIFKALGHPMRIQILDYIKDRPMSTGELSEQFQVTRFAVMKHIDVLEETGLLVPRKVGRTRLNYLNAVPLQQLYQRWVSLYAGQAATSLLSLKEKLEEEERSKTMVEKENKFEISSFQIEQEIFIDAPKESVYDALTERIGEWWAYRLGEDKDAPLLLEPKIGGAFYEDFGNGQGALWGTVTYLKKPVEIRLQGLLGMQGAVQSSYKYVLEEKGTSTLLKLSHHAVGLIEPGWEEGHRKGWEELLGVFLKKYVETGKRPGEYEV
ncbi:helix-turn-helix domain-containing protein [Sutcliffiella halmapala]